jgi:hypothetical protein
MGTSLSPSQRNLNVKNVGNKILKTKSYLQFIQYASDNIPSNRNQYCFGTYFNYSENYWKNIDERQNRTFNISRYPAGIYIAMIDMMDTVYEKVIRK